MLTKISISNITDFLKEEGLQDHMEKVLLRGIKMSGIAHVQQLLPGGL